MRDSRSKLRHSFQEALISKFKLGIFNHAKNENVDWLSGMSALD